MRHAALLLAALLAAGCGEAPDAADDPRPRVVEQRDGIWLERPGEAARRVTALRVDGYDYDSLAAQQREGVVILYWAAAPVLSPDGRRVAYATNREAVSAGTRGQALWLVDLRDGSERPLLARPNRSFRPVGWFGDDVVVYIGDEPGVHGVDVGSGATRRLATGTFVAAADDGAALAVAYGVPDDVTFRVLGRDGFVAVPPAPPGFAYLAQGEFDAHGKALILDAAADSGFTRARFVFDLATGSLARLDAPRTGGSP